MPKKEKKISPKQLELANYEKWLNSVKSQTTNFARSKHPAAANSLVYQLNSAGPRRVIDDKKSLSTPGGSTAPAKDRVYTGTKMLGVAVMHKSNAVPVFYESEARDISAMRR